MAIFIIYTMILTININILIIFHFTNPQLLFLNYFLLHFFIIFLFLLPLYLFILFFHFHTNIFIHIQLIFLFISFHLSIFFSNTFSSTSPSLFILFFLLILFQTLIY
jgi:hypothetical protein